MKKLLYLALLVTAPLAGTAQSITIGQNDAPQIGEKWTDVFDYRYGLHLITPGGPAQTWDYSTSFDPQDTTITNFVSVASTPSNYSADYQAANLASYMPGDTMAVYFKKNANGFYIDGLGMNPVVTPDITINSFRFNPDRLIVPTPFTFGDTRNYTCRLVLEGVFNGIPIRMSTTTYQRFSADAYGSLVTPAGSYPNTLRVREFTYSVDTTYVSSFGGWFPVENTPPHDTTITYTWYKNGPGARLMSIEEDAYALGNSQSASYLGQIILGAQKDVVAGVKSTVYPNPAAGTFITFDIENATASRLVITDMLGRQVKNENITGLNKLIISTTQLQTGTYLYSVVDKNGNKTSGGRFVVTR